MEDFGKVVGLGAEVGASTASLRSGEIDKVASRWHGCCPTLHRRLHACRMQLLFALRAG